MAKRELKTKNTEETAVVTDEPVVDVVEEAVEQPMPIQEGVVTGCSKLNVRKKASVKSDIVCVIDAKSTVVILESDKADWFKVKVKSGVEGYCMKKYIEV